MVDASELFLRGGMTAVCTKFSLLGLKVGQPISIPAQLSVAFMKTVGRIGL